MTEVIDTAHDSRTALAPSVQESTQRDACLRIVGRKGADSRDLLNVRLAPSHHAPAIPPRVERLYVAAEPISGFYADTFAGGPIEAIETPAIAAAPVGTLLITDAAGGTRGMVVAERGLHGWSLVLGDGGRKG